MKRSRWFGICTRGGKRRSEMRFVPSNAWCRGSYFPGPHVRNSALSASGNAGDSATIAPTFKSRFAHPSSRCPIPGANELSTVEWHNAHVTPTLVNWPNSFTVPLTPTTALSRSSSVVTVGLVRSTCPARRAATIALGNASTSTLRPTASAVAGSRVAMGSCMRSTPVHNCSSPNVSKRKIACPSRCREPPSSGCCRSPSPRARPPGGCAAVD
jgi:hypothetical protein